MTHEDYKGLPLIAKLELAKEVLQSEGDLVQQDPLVFVDESVGIHVSDVITDALVFLKRLESRDFGYIQEDFSGLRLSCKAMSPGKTMKNLVMIFDRAAKTGNDLSGNPENWPTVKGLNAVLDTVFEALKIKF